MSMHIARNGAAFSIICSVIALLAFAPSPAHASCTSSSHCYTEGELGPVSSPAGFNGDNMLIRSNCLSVPNPSSDFVTNETWVNFSGGNWTEAGMAYGAPQGGRAYFYWADQRPGGGYHEHDASFGPSMGSYYGT